ncbi:MAG TPA: Uma2 family endonuclease [Candidatus Binatia bacterium]|nr:Uma2 family endonuclease [Candidatus Binatia bacterium]
MRTGIVPAVSAPRRRATYADLLEVPEHLVAEIIDGELITSPRPASPHALAATAIGSALFDRFNGPPGSGDAPGGWWILAEPELHFGEDVLVPDLAGWRRERMPTFPDVAAFTLAPDWACEVISPSTARIDRGRKLRIYARERVAHLWFVDPIVQTVEIYRLDGDRWIVAATHGGSEALRTEPFAAVELDTRRWWREA